MSSQPTNKRKLSLKHPNLKFKLIALDGKDYAKRDRNDFASKMNLFCQAYAQILNIQMSFV